MKSLQHTKVKTVSQYHQLMGLPKPKHPLISVLNFESIKLARRDEPLSLIQSFYSIALKRNFHGKRRYGQQEYETAKVLGDAIGKPGLQWMTFTDQQTQEGLQRTGMPPFMAASLVELGASIQWRIRA